MRARTQTAEAGGSPPVFTKEQILKAERFGGLRDAVAAVLEDGEAYTMDRAEKLVRTFLERKVK